MVHFSYEGGCGVLECMHIKALKGELAWAIHRWLWVISNTVLFKTVIPLRI